MWHFRSRLGDLRPDGASSPRSIRKTRRGAGSLPACQQALQGSLQQALSVTPQQIYGQGPCAGNAQASCFDMNRWVSASGISVPPFPFQNRPTFQQVVELTSTVPR